MPHRGPSIVWLVVTTLAVLVPLAFASPPDATVISGFWDNADYDDVIILATSSSVTIDHLELSVGRLPDVIALISSGDARRLPAAPFFLTSPSRAPPVA
jgi:hypothetical protein